MLTDHDAVLRRSFARARVHPIYAQLHHVDNHRDAAPLDKQTLMHVLRDFVLANETRGVYLVRSGGSTHTPLVFPVDIGENLEQRRVLATHLRAAGIFGPTTIALNIFGYSDLYRTAAILDDLLERCDATTLPMSAHARYEDILPVARRFVPTHLLGTPSKMTSFARFLERAGKPLHVPQLLYAGELLRGSTLELLQTIFATRQVWSLYGGAETGIWAWSDYSRHPGLFEVLPGVVVEILEPAADGFGRIAVTNGYRQRFPVFRYCVGDMGRLVERDGVLLLELRGRDTCSFQFNEMTFDIDRIAGLVDDAEAFQIQLRFDAQGCDVLRLLLVDERGTCALDGLTAQLEVLLQRPAASGAFELTRVERGALHLDPTTTKTPAIVDLRR